VDHAPSTATDDSSSLPVERYLDGAVRLRQAATWNAFDHTLRDNLPRRVIPVVDADVVRMFMAPAAETHYVDPFPSGAADSEELRKWDEPLALVAAATAEFIFLTDTIEVRGQAVRNWSEALRIAPSHFLDVEAMIHQVIAKIVRGLPSIEDLEDDAIAHIDEVLEQGRHHKDGGLNALVHALPESLRDLYLGPVYEAERWSRLVSHGQVLRLDGLAEATPDVVQPSEAAIDRWREPLFEALVPSRLPFRGQKRSHPYPDTLERVRERARERARRDAVALASVTALNEAGLSAGEDKGWRAILISGDDHLHRAYAGQMRKAGGSRLRPEHYILRRPLQFTPVLNVSSMSNDRSASEIFRKLTEALDLTVAMLLDQDIDPPNPFLLESRWESRRRHRIATLDRAGIHKHLERCNEHWLEAINHINARNHPYLTRDYNRLLKKLRTAFDEGDAAQGLLSQTIAIVDGIDAAHFRLVLEETIYEFARLDKPMRMPFLVRADFPGLLDGADGSLERFLYGEPAASQLVRREPADLQPLVERIRSTGGAPGMFLTAILAAVGNSFMRASRLMDRAMQLARPELVDARLLREMTYFSALVTRLTVKGPTDYRETLQTLRRVLDKASGPFELARACSEAAALELHWYATDALRRDNAHISAEQAKHLAEGGRFLAQARASLQWPMARNADRYERELAQQIVVNTVAQNVYLKLAGDEPDAERLRWAIEQFDGLLDGAIEHTDYLTELWYRAAAWLNAQSPESRQALAEHCKRTLDDGSLREMPIADRHDLERIASYLGHPPEPASA
jgi:hypothetical protein